MDFSIESTVPYDPNMGYVKITTAGKTFAAIRVKQLGEALLQQNASANEITIPVVVHPQTYQRAGRKRACLWETAVWETDPLELTYGILPVPKHLGLFRADEICSMAYPRPEHKDARPHGRTALCPVEAGSFFVLTYLSAHRCVQALYRIDSIVPLPHDMEHRLSSSKLEYLAANVTLLDVWYVSSSYKGGQRQHWSKSDIPLDADDLLHVYHRAKHRHDVRNMASASAQYFWMCPEESWSVGHIDPQYVTEAKSGDLVSEIQSLRRMLINAPYDKRNPDFGRYQPLPVEVNYEVDDDGVLQLRIRIFYTEHRTVRAVEIRAELNEQAQIDYESEPALFYRASDFSELRNRIGTSDVRRLLTHI